MLEFIGKGSSGTMEYGGNSAYFKSNRIMYIIDFGYDAYRRLMKLNLLEDVDLVVILITHFHEDHISNLAISLYLPKPVVIVTRHPDKLNQYFNLVLNAEQLKEKLTIVRSSSVDSNVSWKYIDAEHNIDCAYSLLLNIEGTKIYYSSDNRIINRNIVDKFCKGEISMLYQRMKSGKEESSYMSIDYLLKLIPQTKRHLVEAIHLSKVEDIPAIREAGFIWRDPEIIVY